MLLAGCYALMKTKWIILCALTALCGKAFAQTRDIGLQIGLNTPISQTVRIGNDIMFGVSYGQFPRPHRQVCSRLGGITGWRRNTPSRCPYLKLTPAIHYNLTDNYVHHLSTIENGVVTKDRTTPLRWFFTLNGGVSFRF